ncbi:hypothetical protein [Chitinophaga tropicalis]|uniref:Uncharacterized protein n=1 Tax=Chitinophaga tropicalis TaxID=2683588 RepID=A0A7K1U6S5_9BACT|nr:hypothetical protein [Chitinophaga tropicalis]MVT10049.1 hypothetical protein [Chitinophaga tropicalis]
MGEDKNSPDSVPPDREYLTPIPVQLLNSAVIKPFVVASTKNNLIVFPKIAI